MPVNQYIPESVKSSKYKMFFIYRQSHLYIHFIFWFTLQHFIILAISKKWYLYLLWSYIFLFIIGRLLLHYKFYYFFEVIFEFDFKTGICVRKNKSIFGFYYNCKNIGQFFDNQLLDETIFLIEAYLRMGHGICGISRKSITIVEKFIQNIKKVVSKAMNGNIQTDAAKYAYL